MQAGSDLGPARPAVFLDRDGVLIEDVDLLTDAAKIVLCRGAVRGCARLHAAGFPLVIVTNQTVVARGLATETDVAALNDAVARRLAEAGGPRLEGFYVCPHHPSATLPAYRARCTCRKPQPGLLHRAAEELLLDLPRSYMIGDRPSDIAAGRSAGCSAVLVRTGRHADAPIEGMTPSHPVQPDAAVDDLDAAADWILGHYGR